MKKGDFIILFVLIFVVFASFFILTYNGKDIKNVKAVIKVESESSADKVKEIVMKNETIAEFLKDKNIKKEVYVPKKIYSIVI